MRAKRWLSLLLAAAMTVSGVPVTALASDVSENENTEIVETIEETDPEESEEMEEDISAGEEVQKGDNIASGKSNNITWVIDADGCLTISGSGNYKGMPWFDYTDSIKTAKVTATDMTDCSWMFAYCGNLKSIDFSNFRTDKVTDMAGMFYCSGLTTLDLSNFNTGKVTDMQSMFYSCSELVSLDLHNFNTANVTNMDYMFYGCKKLATINLSSFNTAKVRILALMFSHCEALKSIDLSNFNTSRVTEMAQMFSYCSSLTEVNVSSFNTRKTESFTNMFQGCTALTSLDLSNFDMSSNSYPVDYMLDECSSLVKLKTPKNLKSPSGLPSNAYPWTDSNGTTYTQLPKNRSTSIEITCDGIHKITYNNCAGATNPNPTTYTEGVGLALQDASKPGYNFLGWYSDKKLTKKVTSISSETKKTIVLYAKWSAIKYTVSYDRNESYIKDYDGETALSCSGSMKKQTITGGKSTALSGNGFTVKGYRFVEWNTAADGSGTSYSNKAKVTYFDTTNVILYAIWEKETYQIKYVGLTDAEVAEWDFPTEYHVDDATIDYETLKGQISRTGYTFGGLYKDSKYKTAFKSIPTNTTGNKTVYAKLTPISYKVAFSGNFDSINDFNGTKIVTGGKMSVQTMTYDKAAKLTKAAFTVKGYIFTGWNTKADGSGTTYANQQVVPNLTDQNETVTLYARWAKTDYSIVYKNLTAEEVEAAGLPTKYQIDSEDIVFTGYPAPVRTGYHLVNYYTTKDFKTVYKKIQKGTTGSKTVYARWTANKYTITYDGNGALKGKVAAQKNLSYSAKVTLNKNAFTAPAGATFNGWNTKADGSGTAFKAGQKVSALVSEDGGSITLYAQWKYKTDASDTIDWDSYMIPESGAAFLNDYDEADTFAHNIYSDPVLTKTSGTFSGFLIDFKTDHQAQNTYWALCNWSMNTDYFEQSTGFTVTDAGGAYGGLQRRTSDTTAIMSFWKIDYTKPGDSATYVLNARQVYPEGSSSFDNEGSGTNCITTFDWQADTWYRFYLNCYWDETGETFVEEWIEDIAEKEWTLICRFDTGLQYSYMQGSMSQFMENFDGRYRNQVRTFEYKNLYVQDFGTGTWKAITSSDLSVDTCFGNKLGNAAFGATTNKLVGITCGAGEDQFAADEDTTERFSVVIDSPALVPNK